MPRQGCSNCSQLLFTQAVAEVSVDWVVTAAAVAVMMLLAC